MYLGTMSGVFSVQDHGFERRESVLAHEFAAAIRSLSERTFVISQTGQKTPVSKTVIIVSKIQLSVPNQSV